MATKVIDKQKISENDTDNLASQEKLLASINQLSQVLDILGKLVSRIKQQVETMPAATDSNDKKTLTSIDKANKKKGSLIH